MMCNNANMFSVKGRFRVRVGLGDRNYHLVSIKVRESLWKVPTYIYIYIYIYFLHLSS